MFLAITIGFYISVLIVASVQFKCTFLKTVSDSSGCILYELCIIPSVSPITNGLNNKRICLYKLNG